MSEVSIIIPTYRRYDKLPLTIDSVLKQTFTDVEIIIVNDFEDDKPERDIIERFCDKRIHYIRNKRQKGTNGARNTGFEQAKGKYIAFLDDDDNWYPQKIEKQIKMFNESSEDIGFVYSGFDIASCVESEPFKKILPQKRGDVLKDMIKANFVGSPTPLIRKNIFLKTGLYDENLESAQDWDLWIRIASNTKFDYVNDILARYVVHGHQISIDFDKKIKAMDYILNKYATLYKNNKKARANIYKRTAVLSFMNGRINECRKRIIKGLTINSVRVDLPVHLLLSFFPSIYMLYIEKFITRNYGGIKLVY